MTMAKKKAKVRKKKKAKAKKKAHARKMTKRPDGVTLHQLSPTTSIALCGKEVQSFMKKAYKATAGLLGKHGPVFRARVDDGPWHYAKTKSAAIASAKKGGKPQVEPAKPQPKAAAKPKRKKKRGKAKAKAVVSRKGDFLSVVDDPAFVGMSKPSKGLLNIKLKYASVTISTNGSPQVEVQSPTISGARSALELVSGLTK
jgi:hypothetical protein